MKVKQVDSSQYVHIKKIRVNWKCCSKRKNKTAISIKRSCEQMLSKAFLEDIMFDPNEIA